MARLQLGPMPAEVTPAVLGKFFRLIEHAVNFLDKRNFPNPVEGSIIKSDTLSGSALVNWSVAMKKLAVPRWHVDLCLPASAFTTTSTTFVNVGPYYRWRPGDWPSGSWYLEATIYSGNAAATATLQLTGTAAIGSVRTTSTSAVLVTSAALTMPTTEQNIWLQLKTDNASYAAGFLGARLVFVPS